MIMKNIAYLSLLRVLLTSLIAARTHPTLPGCWNIVRLRAAYQPHLPTPAMVTLGECLKFAENSLIDNKSMLGLELAVM